MTTKKKAPTKASKARTPEKSAQVSSQEAYAVEQHLKALRADRDGYNAILNLPLMGMVDIFGCRVIRVAGGGYQYLYPNANLHPTVVHAPAKEAQAELMEALGRCDDAIKQLEGN